MKSFWLMVLLVVVSCPAVWAEHVYPFAGRLNLAEKNLNFSIKLDQDAALQLNVKNHGPDEYEALLNVQNVQTPFFEMTTDLKSVVKVHCNNDRVNGLSGSFWSQYSLLDHKTVPEMSGRFDLKNGKLSVDDLLVAGVSAEGSIGILAPHPLEAAIDFNSLAVSDFLDWLSGERKKFSGEGDLSGTIALSGILGRVSLKASIMSDGGQIENLAYDRMSLQLQGIYPIVELTNSSITKTNGFSFNLDGRVNLSDKENMTAQLSSIKTVPLVKDSDAQTEWVLKRVQDQGQDIETKYFIKKDKGGVLSNAGENNDYGVFGVERKIGF